MSSIRALASVCLSAASLLLPFAAALQKAHSSMQDPTLGELNEVAESKQKLQFVSLNTEGELAISAAGFPAEVVNVGANRTWKGYGSKLVDIYTYATRVPDDTILVYVDGNDVVWGGCSRNDFLERYNSIAKVSGAPMVLGAELVCGEQDCSNTTAIPSWVATLADQRAARLRQGANSSSSASLSQRAATNSSWVTLARKGVVRQYLECEEQVKSDCRCDMPSQPVCRNFEYTGEDDADWNETVAKWAEERAARKKAHANLLQTLDKQGGEEAGMLFRFINTGFIMGPAKEFREMFQWAIFHYLTVKGDRSYYHDQGALAEYWKRNPSLVALDYFGELSLQLPRLAPHSLTLERSSRSGGQVARNALLAGDMQCMIHNNVNEWNGGTRQKFWWDFVEKLSPTKADWWRQI